MTDASTIRAQLPATPRELVQGCQDELIAGLMEYVSHPSVSATGEGFPPRPMSPSRRSSGPV